MEQGKPWWVNTLYTGALVAVMFLFLGPIGTKLGAWAFTTGFALIAVAALLSIIGFTLGVVAILIARRRDLSAAKQKLYVALVISVAILALLGNQFLKATSVPEIHNISTDVNDPPAFAAVVDLRGENSNPLAYDKTVLSERQLTAYPEVRTLNSDLNPADALARASDLLESMGLEIVNVDQASNIVEATATTFWFGFKDDVVVRIRAADDGSLVDMRSVSRIGQSDLGANAARIMTFLRQF